MVAIEVREASRLSRLAAALRAHRLVGASQSVANSPPSERTRFRRWLVAMALVGAMSGVADAHRSVTPPSPLPFPLDEMSFKDAERVGAIGTGCTWRGGPGMAQRMSIADDRGGIRRNGEVVALRPAADAKPLFVTYDRWTDGTTTIRIRDTGRVVRRGREFSETVAWLDYVEVGRRRSFAGRLNCGS